jgi:hypothetical protein
MYEELKTGLIVSITFKILEERSDVRFLARSMVPESKLPINIDVESSEWRNLLMKKTI